MTCTFQGVDDEEQLGRPDTLQPAGIDGSPAIGTRSGSITGTAVGLDRIDLGQYVDQVCSEDASVLGIRSDDKLWQTLLSVSPQLPLEIVMQMFRRMG